MDSVFNSHTERWLQFAFSKQIARKDKKKILEIFPSLDAVMNLTAQDLELAFPQSKNKLYVALNRIWESDVSKIINMTKDVGADYIDREHAFFPKKLLEIPDAPFGLFSLGDAKLLLEPQIAMVGSRKPTTYGRLTASAFSQALSRNGFVITSGLAHGIDGFSHQGCLDIKAKTIAVLGSGIDKIYPAAHRKLYDDIYASGGLLLSEYAPGTPPHRSHFPERNRIISGLSLGVLVVEATIRSGSLITARLAGEQGIDVFAVPGLIYTDQSKGCHFLIKNGAKLVEKVEDILEELTHNMKGSVVSQEEKTVKFTPEEKVSKLVYNALEYYPKSIEVILDGLELSLDDLLPELINLEIKGLVIETLEGYQKTHKTY